MNQINFILCKKIKIEALKILKGTTLNYILKMFINQITKTFYIFVKSIKSYCCKVEIAFFMNIKIKQPDGFVRECPKGVTSMEIALSISEGLARNVLAAKVNTGILNLNRCF